MLDKLKDQTDGAKATVKGMTDTYLADLRRKIKQEPFRAMPRYRPQLIVR